MKKLIFPLALIATGFAILSLAKPRFSQTPASGQPAVEAVATAATSDTASPSDLSGEWVLDRSRSDAPWMRGGGGRGMWGGPRQGRGDGFGGREGQLGGRRGEGGPGRRMRLPMHLHITQTASLVSFADSAGTVVQEIATGSDTAAGAPGVVHRQGTWHGGALEVRREGRGGATFVESWSLEGPGTLVCTTRIQGGEMGDRTMKRVYRRVKES